MLFDFVGRVNEFSSDQAKVIGTKIPITGIGAVVKAGFQNHFSLRQVSQKLSFRNRERDVFETQRDSTCMYLTECGSEGEIQIGIRTC